MGNFGPWEIALIVLVVLLIFGPKRLPQLGRSLGRGLREFKSTVTDHTREIREATVDTPKEFTSALNPMAPAERPAESGSAPAPLVDAQPAHSAQASAIAIFVEEPAQEELATPSQSSKNG